MEIYQELEHNYAEWGEKNFGIAVNTGTAALHLALLALGVKSGDEVIVPDFTFASVAFSVTYCGATPIFVDIDEDYNIDPLKVKEAITKKTKAIIVVHTYGRKARVTEIQELTSLPIIEDVSEAQGIKLCPGTIATFSLYKNKILPAEEGGIILVDNKEMKDLIVSMKNMANDGRYFHKTLGFNYRMTNSQARLGLDSFNRKEEIFKQRWEILDKYLTAFGGKKPDTPWVFDKLSYHLTEVLEKIPDSRPFFKPQSSFPIYNLPPKERTLDISKIGFIICLIPQYNHSKIITDLTPLT